MKLLFDHNLSPKLVKIMDTDFPNSSHVFLLGLDKSDDLEIWDYAKENSYILVTKDADFSDLSVLRGFPPNVIWILRGNCKTKEIEKILRNNIDTIRRLETDPVIGLISLTV